MSIKESDTQLLFQFVQDFKMGKLNTHDRDLANNNIIRIEEYLRAKDQARESEIIERILERVKHLYEEQKGTSPNNL